VVHLPLSLPKSSNCSIPELHRQASNYLTFSLSLSIAGTCCSESASRSLGSKHGLMHFVESLSGSKHKSFLGMTSDCPSSPNTVRDCRLVLARVSRGPVHPSPAGSAPRHSSSTDAEGLCRTAGMPSD
jgi:hypothetical protein